MSGTFNLKVIFLCMIACCFLRYYDAGQVPCTEGVFQCANGYCTRYNWLCDGGDDCKDNSDEQFCAAGPCPKFTFQCLNGKCISRWMICDGNDNCGDNSDEQMCAGGSCHPLAFQCLNGRCLPWSVFCSGNNKKNSNGNCGDNSDERYCAKSNHTACPIGWFECPNKQRCIPLSWVCNGYTECIGESEEKNCGNNIAKTHLKSWLMRHRKTGFRTTRWGSQVHRITVALHFADNFISSNGEEIGKELTIQLLHRLAKDKKLSTQELALYIHALLVACINPRDFYGEDLVRELRRRVELAGQFTNPFMILVLCNAGDTMTAKDVERVSNAYDSVHRPFWTDFQALATMVLSCISSHSSGLVDERIIMDMLQELKKHQFRNGTVDNFRTTALVAQALFIHDSYKRDFDLDAAIKVLTDGLNQSMSIQNAYYALPVFSRKSLLNVSSSHCIREPVSEDDALQKTLDVKGETITVHYSVWMGEDVNVGQTWRLRMRLNSTIYDAIETVAKIDNRQKVVYNVVNGKPFVSALNGKEDDPEMGLFWFIYLKTLHSDENPKITEESPVDIKLNANQEIILWYKRGTWNRQNTIQNSVTPA